MTAGAQEQNTTYRLVDFAVRAYRASEVSLGKVGLLSSRRSEAFFRAVRLSGGLVMVCETGRFRVVLADGETLELGADEALVLFPGSVVTVETAPRGGSLHYVLLEGSKVDSLLGGHGFYDRMRLSIESHEPAFRSLLEQSERGVTAHVLLAQVFDVLRFFQQEQRRTLGGALNDAIRTLQTNLDNGEADVKSACAALGVSRTFLNVLFAESGLPPPGAFMRREQLRRACQLLVDTNLPIAEIGRRVGVMSPVYFTAFVRRLTGLSPKEVRKGRQVSRSQPISR